MFFIGIALIYFRKWVAKAIAGGKQGAGGKTNEWIKLLPFAVMTVGIWTLIWAKIPFFGGTLANTIATPVGWILNHLGSAADMSGTRLATWMLVLGTLAAIIDVVRDKHPDGMAKTMVVAAPILAVLAGGSLAQQVLQTTSNIGPSLMSLMPF